MYPKDNSQYSLISEQLFGGLFRVYKTRHKEEQTASPLKNNTAGTALYR